MKSFFKYVLATIVGIILSSVLLLFLSIFLLGIIVASQDKAVEVKSNTILYLKLNQQIVDRKPAMPFEISTLSRANKIGLNELLANIDKAKADPDIKGIHLDLSYVPAGIGTLKEIRNALLDFKSTGKFVTVYAETMAQGAYYLASAADEIYLNPVGFFEWVGLRTQSVFFKDAFAKLDIQPTVIRHGKFKSAGESFSENGYSKENREQLSDLLDSYWKSILEDIEKSRNVSVESLNEMAENLIITGPEAAVKQGLADSLIFKDEMIELLKQKSGIESTEDLRTISLSDYKSVPRQKEFKGLAKEKIAILYANGEIIGGEGDDQNIGSSKFARTIRKARKDSTIKALVIRINSPGGSAIASDVIWRELRLTRDEKPVIVSMGDIAASGGYYIACMADSIYAQPTTLTGSIGVIGMHLNTQGLFNRYGIKFDTEKTNTYSDFLSGVREASPAELNYWQNMVDNFYSTFIQRIDESRTLSYSEIDAIAQGRIWSGTDALEIGLVDKLGGLADAVETAKNMAGLEEKYSIVELPKQDDPFEKIIKDLTQTRYEQKIERKLGIDGEYFSTLKILLEHQGVLARMPYNIHIQ